MKRKLIYIFIPLLCIHFNVAASNTDTLKVMTYNLRFGELASLQEIGSYIKSQNPDIVALQECDWKTSRKLAPNQNGKAFINELAYYSQLFGLYGKSIDYAGGYYGIGLLSKYPIIKSERIFLPNPFPKQEQRVMLVAQIEMPDKSILTFISTHLDVSSEDTRKLQIDFINKKIKAIKTPVILAGDFNATPDEITVKEGFIKWMDVTDNSLTFSTRTPEKKIDYILCYPENRFQLISTKTNSDCKLSDHFPVSSIVVLKNNK